VGEFKLLFLEETKPRIPRLHAFDGATVAARPIVEI